MRTRLVGIFSLLSVLIALALGVPLGLSVSDSAGRELFLDRFSDAELLASASERVLLEDRPGLIADKLRRFEQVYGADSAVVDVDFNLVAGAGRMRMSDPGVRGALTAAMAGRKSGDAPLITPWSARSIVLAAPVLVEGQLRGAVVTRSSTANARTFVLHAWLLIGCGTLLALGVGLLVSLPLSRWFLRPVRRMDSATGEATAAVLAGRPIPDPGVGGGPPELRRLAGSVFTMADRAATALQAQREFVADASHQLRNPLTALQLRISNMRDALPADAAGDADAAAEEVDRLTGTLDELLAVARAESWAGATRPVRIEQVLHERVDAWQPAASAVRARLVQRCETEAAVRLAEGGLATVLDALLDNAIKFTGPGTAIEVHVYEAPSGTARIEVSDRGPGLQDGELDRATDRFWRSPRHQNVAGSGLGLAIVERIVQRGGGGLEVANRAGGGLLVRVTLPADGAQEITER